MTPVTLTGVPNQPKTPQHSFRVADDIWNAGLENASARGENLTNVLVRALEVYNSTGHDPWRELIQAAKDTDVSLPRLLAQGISHAVEQARHSAQEASKD